MEEFAYNNAKNTSTSYMSFELNCDYQTRMLYEEKVDPRFQLKSADELLAKLKELMIIWCENTHNAQELQKRTNDKSVKLKSYVPDEKVWLNSKYIRTKQNQKLEAKFFGPFRVLHHVGKQAYKLELPGNWKFHDVFYVSLLEHDTTRKKWVDKKVRQMEFNNNGNNSSKYKVEVIWDSAVYARESKGHLSGPYYLVS